MKKNKDRKSRRGAISGAAMLEKGGKNDGN